MTAEKKPRPGARGAGQGWRPQERSSWPAGRRSSRGSAGLLGPPGSDRMLCGGSKGARLPTSLASGHTPFWSHCL